MTGITTSSAFFECDPSFTIHEKHPIKSRLFCLSLLLKKALLLPLTLTGKAISTLFRILGLSLSITTLFLTLGFSESAREFFKNRMSCLGLDIADWIIFPFAILICFVKLILGGIVNPLIYHRSSCE